MLTQLMLNCVQCCIVIGACIH